MCGFFGIFGASSPDLTENQQERISKSLAHRGPDEFQVLENPNYRVMFWRLSIVDQAGGKQPMRSLDGLRTILFNGEVYNYKSLRQYLQKEGVAFRTQSDTEVILAAYEKWGSACFNRFEGMFAVCVIDEAKDRIILARDRLGVKPVYFRQDAAGLAVASEQKALLSFCQQSPTIDRTGLLHYLVFQTVLESHTMFEGISKVPPGFVLEFRLRTQELINSRKIESLISWPQPTSYTEYRELARSVIEDQARLAFDSELPACFHLSGGLDSNILVALSRRLFPSKKFICLSSLVEGDQDPEAQLIRNSAQYHGLPLKLSVIGEENFFGALDDVIYHLDEPVGDPGVVAQFLVNQLAEGEAKIVYSGQGFDELFFGYTRDLASFILADLGPGAFDPEGLSYDKVPANTRQFFEGWEDFLKPLARQTADSAPLVLFKKLCRFDPFNGARAFSDGLMSSLRSVALEAFVKLQEGSSNLHDFMLHAETSIQLPSLLHMEDRASMRYSLETRVPFCTASILDLAKKSQLSWKFHEGKPKGVLRDIFTDMLPPAIASRRQKVGRPIPFRKWLDGKSGQPFRRDLQARREFFGDLLGVDFVGYALDHPNPYDRSAWAALSISKWFDLYQVRV